jgi:hypothetical protein
MACQTCSGKPSKLPSPVTEHLFSLCIIQLRFISTAKQRSSHYYGTWRKANISHTSVRSKHHLLRNSIHYLLRHFFASFHIEEEGGGEEDNNNNNTWLTTIAMFQSPVQHGLKIHKKKLEFCNPWIHIFLYSTPVFIVPAQFSIKTCYVLREYVWPS